MQKNTKERLQELEKEIDVCKKRTVMGFLGVGKALWGIKENDLWRFSEAKGFDQYCERIQGFKKSWGYALINVYEKMSPILLADESLKMIDVTRCVRLLPYITDSNKVELLHMAATCPAPDFDANLRNLAGKKAPDECTEHEWRIIKQCKKCGLKVKGE